jgi:3'-phosphoadenosine 5'-phosphosulfate sulfotransferase (PAPS reductase)/FAD synthetase
MVIDWTEEEVWNIMREYNVVPHPAYRLGWGRVSCLACIFGQRDQWASVRLIAPDLFNRIAGYERVFSKTIHRGKSVVDLADRGAPYAQCYNPELVALAMSRQYPARLALTDHWTLPAGAFRHCGGPS